MNNFPRYDTYKDSGVDWLGEIPDHWKVKRLKYLLNERYERSETGNEPLFMVSQTHGLVVRADHHEKADVAQSNVGNKRVHKNDLVFNKLKAHLGVFYKSNIDFVGIVSPDYAVYYPIGEIEDLKFLELLFRHPAYIAQFISKATGIVEGLIRLYTSDLFSLEVPVPPIDEQTAMVNFLESKTTQIDQAIAQKERLIELLKERRQILIHKAVTRGLNPNVKLKHSGVDWIGEIPEHWEVKRLKFAANLISEKILSKDSSFNYIGMENIESFTGKYVLTNSEVEGLASYFKTGDVLFGKLRPYLAKVYLAEKEGICSSEFLIYRALWQIYNFYLHLLMLSWGFINLIDSSTYGSKMPRASSEFVGNQLIPIPPKSEQKEIAEYLENVSAKIETSISCKQREIEKLKEYRAVLINSAVTGKIKVCGNSQNAEVKSNYAKSNE